MLEMEDCLAEIAEVDEVLGVKDPASLSVLFHPVLERFGKLRAAARLIRPPGRERVTPPRI
jgi:hypothetical protein